MQPLQICIGPTIRIGRESRCLPYAGFFCIVFTICTRREIQSLPDAIFLAKMPQIAEFVCMSTKEVRQEYLSHVLVFASMGLVFASQARQYAYAALP